MKALLRRPSTYLGLPMLLACGATLLTYDLPEGYLDGVLLLIAGAVAMLALDALSGVRLPPFERFALREYAGTREAMVAFAFCALVAVFCLLDLALFPIPLLDKPSAYAQMEGGREHIRHLSAWCWVLPPVGLLCVRHRGLRYAMVLAGIVFPILVIDRNRIFASLFSVALVLVLRRKGGLRLPWPAVLLLGLVGAVLFAVLGILRSGPLEGVTLPFGALYREAPPGVKWLLLYLTAGPYNFASMLAKQYHNADFLLNQVVPLRGSIVTAGTGIPLDSPTINVGTEYFPFLLALGPAGAVAAMLGLYAMLVWSARRLCASTSLFSLLIFLRMAYVAAMAPFAPQAYTFMSAGFIALCLLMQLFAAWLPRRPPSSFSLSRVDHHAP
ncbi:hypothetical protein FHW84_003639 [Dyella sp. SG562]|uniref:hypothetical protein n=1 Tax=Dyella sp. SG562 TaxID=2587017 RepID=UPI00141E79C2|nr:hypothetical protein [Dyella sp. SG562]NII75041.1 hypothetical protein [Dyella sp. SG562]